MASKGLISYNNYEEINSYLMKYKYENNQNDIIEILEVLRDAKWAKIINIINEREYW